METGTETPRTELEQLQEDWKFIYESEELPGGFVVHKLHFEDGRAYRFQEPDFFTIHEAIREYGDLYVAGMRLGVKNLFPMNEQSPKINDEYLRKKKNRGEGIGLWSRFFTEVLFREADPEPKSDLSPRVPE